MTSDPTGTTVNIVVRTRDRPLLLARAVDDVLGQRFQDWVLTVVNDGGEKGAVDAVLAARSGALAGRDTVIHHETSVGMEAASNVGIRATSSQFVAIHDDDDTWDPGFLATTSSWLTEHEAAPAVAVRTEIVWESLENGRIVELEREVFLPERRQITLFDLIRFNSAVPISMLYRRSALTDIGLFDESLDVAGDWEANVRLAAQGEIGYLGDRTLAYWHQRPGAAGPLGNTVIALADRHSDNDRVVRDRALRDYAQREGLGLPLYLTRFLDDRFDEVRTRLDELAVRVDSAERHSRDTPYHRVKHLLRRLGRRPGR